MGQRSGSYDSLRNFPLRLNMIEELQLNASALAAEMAIGLAILHWQTQVDGMDTELVLGSASQMLDFDRATSIELTRDDEDTKLVPAFLGNDPYYPRPDEDRELWKEFAETYLEASCCILEGWF